MLIVKLENGLHHQASSLHFGKLMESPLQSVPTRLPLPGPQLLLCWTLQTAPHASQPGLTSSLAWGHQSTPMGHGYRQGVVVVP